MLECTLGNPGLLLKGVQCLIFSSELDLESISGESIAFFSHLYPMGPFNNDSSFTRIVSQYIVHDTIPGWAKLIPC